MEGLEQLTEAVRGVEKAIRDMEGALHAIAKAVVEAYVVEVENEEGQKETHARIALIRVLSWGDPGKCVLPIAGGPGRAPRSWPS